MSTAAPASVSESPARRLQGSAAAVTAWLRRHPFTAGLLLVILLASIAQIVITSPPDADTGLLPPWNDSFDDFRWWSAITPMFVTGSLPELLTTLILAGVVVSQAERVMGTVRAAIAYIAGGLLVTSVSIAVGLLEEHFLAFLPLNDVFFFTLTPLAAIVCTAMAASCFIGALWRRRVRLASLLAVCVLFLYRGDADSLFILVALPVGLAVGFVLGGRRARTLVVRSSHHEIRVLLASLVAVGGIGPVIATWFGSGTGLLSFYGFLSIDPVVVVDGTTCAFGSAVDCPSEYTTAAEVFPAAGWIALLPMIIALIAAWGILRGRRAALWIAIVLNAAVFGWILVQWITLQPETVADIAAYQGTDAEPYVWQTISGALLAAIAPLGTTIALVVFRRHLRVTSSPRARRRYLVVLGTATVLTALVATAGQVLTRQGHEPVIDFGDILLALPLRFIPPTLLPPDVVSFVPETFEARVFWYLPPAIFWAGAVLATAYLIFAPAAVGDRDDRIRARAMLRAGGGDSFSFMSTWPGNSYWFAPDGTAAIAYQVHHNVAVTVGGPFGPAFADVRVFEQFAAFCGDNGWRPVFYSVSDGPSAELASRGWYRLRIAEEALLDAQEWTPAGKKRQDIRTATNKAAREGVTAVWTRWADLSIAQHLQLRTLSESWLADKELPEMEFTLGGLDQVDDPDVRLMLAIADDGRIEAITSWLPLYGPDGLRGYVLDVMRRRHEAFNGVMEFVIGAVVVQLKEEGLQTLSLSGAPLAYTAEGASESDAVQRTLDLAGSLLEPGYGFRSLHNFKRKFQPDFSPVWLVVADTAALPATGLALVRCYLPQLTLRQAARMAATLGRDRARA